MAYRIKNWAKFQHFKDRRPPWVKLHRELLDDREFNALSPMACKVLVMLWLIASESLEGTITSDIESLAFRLRLPEKPVRAAMAELETVGFLLDSESDDEEADTKATAKSIAAKNGFGSRHISDATKRAVWERDGGKCVYCEATEAIEYDHKHPVSKGGNSEPENIQLLCRPCNRKKRTKTAEQVATQAQPWLSIRTSETETEEETKKEKSGAVALLLSKEIPEDLARDFVAIRKAKKAPLTETALAGIQREADAAGMTLEKALRECCARGWQGFKAEWVQGKATPTSTTPTNPKAIFVPEPSLTPEQLAANRERMAREFAKLNLTKGAH